MEHRPHDSEIEINGLTILLWEADSMTFVGVSSAVELGCVWHNDDNDFSSQLPQSSHLEHGFKTKELAVKYLVEEWKKQND